LGAFVSGDIQVKKAIAVALGMLFCQPVLAADPQAVTAAIAEYEKLCAELESPRLIRSEGFLRTADFNGDGKKDYLLDTASAECQDMPSAFCGTGGCTVTILVSQNGGYVTAFDSNIRTLKIRKQGKRDVLDVDFHGSACDKVGYEACPKRLIWDGSKMAIRNRR
jgi:hypothetical protein